MNQCPKQSPYSTFVKLTNTQKQYQYPEAYEAMQTLT